VSGRIGVEQLPELGRSLEAERGQEVVLDLAEVGLVDVEAVQYLAQCERHGIRIERCPGYVREWMDRESRAAGR
jgi:hypothetical protein